MGKVEPDRKKLANETSQSWGSSLKLVCSSPRSDLKVLYLMYPQDAVADQQTLSPVLGRESHRLWSCDQFKRDLRLTIVERFSLPDVHIINGDTAATAGRGLSRQGIIDKFQAQPVFGVIILSTSCRFWSKRPGCDHVIHFTRSLESRQRRSDLTDRTYRIGQTREVHVYYPHRCLGTLPPSRTNWTIC